MSQQSPLEFWIQLGTPDMIAESAKEMAECQNEHRILCPVYHVIEKSAYDQQAAEIAELKARVYVLKDSALRTYDGLAQKADLADELASVLEEVKFVRERGNDMEYEDQLLLAGQIDVKVNEAIANYKKVTGRK